MPAKEKKRKSGGATNGRKVKNHFETKPLLIASSTSKYQNLITGSHQSKVTPCMISFQVNKVRKKHANASPGDVEVFACIDAYRNAF